MSGAPHHACGFPYLPMVDPGGEIVNIAGGLGRAADILDMSFALQLG
jgi:hypothetical protein